ncbi:MAG TPA: site-2 protease family protein [Stellaceae bacterium]|nr:site-2 protease family protein [Stellaceae bacterium]
MIVDGQIANAIRVATTWVLPVIFAVTLHEAAHGFAALQFGDDTARRAGRVSFNPLNHIDPFGTLLLPALLIIARVPFLFGYAKPVPVNFGRLKPLRLGMIMVALAGPMTNVLLAIVSALLAYALHLLPMSAVLWARDNLRNSIELNVVLCVFNMLPLPPLDGGRVLVGILPRSLAMPIARLEPYGMLILMGLFLLSYLGTQAGLGFSLLGWLIGGPANILYEFVLAITGQG